MTEYQRIQYHQALQCIEQEDLTAEDREMLRAFAVGMDAPDEAAAFDQNMVFCWRLLGESRLRRREQRQADKERRLRAKGGQATARRRAEQNSHAWMAPIFDAAWVRLDAECKKRIGHGMLLKEAWRIAGRDHPRREELTEHQARAYLARRKSIPR